VTPLLQELITPPVAMKEKSTFLVEMAEEDMKIQYLKIFGYLILMIVSGYLYLLKKILLILN
jgi:hypothetical protein